ncbi:MAG: CHAT domain-containing protein, partial [Nannocystaceae bacterium]|nr:CHAT domain-containing protein [Nannocystaceae bacterium]
WRRAYWKGRVSESLGRANEAIASYRVAEDVLATMARSLRLDGGREGLLMKRQPSSARLVDLLLERERYDEALCVARTARSRADQLLARTERLAALSPRRRERWRAAGVEIERLQRALAASQESRHLLPIDERADHDRAQDATATELSTARSVALGVLYGARSDREEAPCDALRTPSPSELALLLFPLDPPQQRWGVFAFDAKGTRAARIEFTADDPTALIDLLQGRFASTLETAESLRVLATASTWSTPFASLPWRGSPLLEHVPISLSLDLATPLSEAPTHRNALVVGDPNGDLEQARLEAVAIATALHAEGWQVTTLQGQAATVDRLRTAVGEVSLLHFAGHAREAGIHGWESRVQLGAGGRLDARDILGLDATPQVAILPACEVVATSQGSLGGGMSVARSLLLSGTEVVVGGTHKLDDGIARSVSEALYAAGVPTTAEEATRSLHGALLKVAAETGDPAVLDSFVALVP